MYYYYNEAGDIVSMSHIEINVKDASVINFKDEINPSEYQIINKELIKRKQAISIIEKIEEPKPLDENVYFLNQTDYKVIRHREQIELGIDTSMTNDEYIALLHQRQTARNNINKDAQ